MVLSAFGVHQGANARLSHTEVMKSMVESFRGRCYLLKVGSHIIPGDTNADGSVHRPGLRLSRRDAAQQQALHAGKILDRRGIRRLGRQSDCCKGC